MGVINSVAQFERDLLIERTQSGLTRAKAGGEAFGRPPTQLQRRNRGHQDELYRIVR
jgi:putative DNA-invertase from lambdoid prophage Rac